MHSAPCPSHTHKLDKGTEYWPAHSYPRKTRGTGTPVELLKQYITTTGRITSGVSCSRRRPGSYAAVGIEGASHRMPLRMNLLALPQFVIVGSGCSPRARTQTPSESHVRQHHDGGGDGGEGGTSVGVSDVRTHSVLNPHSSNLSCQSGWCWLLTMSA